MNKISKPIEITPKDLLLELLDLEKEHNDLVDKENASRTRRLEIQTYMIGIKKILQKNGVNVEQEIKRLRRTKKSSK